VKPGRFTKFLSAKRMSFSKEFIETSFASPSRRLTAVAV